MGFDSFTHRIVDMQSAGGNNQWDEDLPSPLFSAFTFLTSHFNSLSFYSLQGIIEPLAVKEHMLLGATDTVCDLITIYGLFIETPLLEKVAFPQQQLVDQPTNNSAANDQKEEEIIHY
jgi:hypothetical protein